MGKAIGFGIGIAAVVGIVGFIFFLGSGASLEQSGSSYLEQGLSEPKEPSLYELSEEELKQLVVDWEYDDILRNFEKYKGKVIRFDGKIFRVETIGKDHYALTVWESRDSDVIVVDFRGSRLLSGDEIIVYGTVDKIIEVGSMLASDWKNPYPVVTAVRYSCLNC